MGRSFPAEQRGEHVPAYGLALVLRTKGWKSMVSVLGFRQEQGSGKRGPWRGDEGLWFQGPFMPHLVVGTLSRRWGT